MGAQAGEAGPITDIRTSAEKIVLLVPARGDLRRTRTEVEALITRERSNINAKASWSGVRYQVATKQSLPSQMYLNIWTPR